MNITTSDFSVASNGDLRSIAGSATYTALELHAWLQDLADNPAPTSDDHVSILGGNPSELAGKRNTLRPMAVTLLNGVNVDDVTSRRFNFGSIEQQGGQVLYTGLKTIGTVPGDASIYIVQNNAKINGGTKWWPAGPVQTMIKAKAAGSLIAGNTVAGVTQAAGFATVFSRQFGRTYTHFDVDLSPGSEQQAALSISTDPNVTLSSAQAQAKFADITITVGTTNQTLGGVTKEYRGTITLANGITVAEAYQALQWATSESSTATINGEPGWRYRKLLSSYPENQAAPFGTFAGGKFFVAQGWWLAGVLPADSKNYQLISHDGTTVTPPTTISVTVGNLVVGDYVIAAIDNGAGGFQATHTATGSAAATTVTLSPAPSATQPNAGTIRINGNRHSYTGKSGSTLTGLSPAIPAGGYSSAAAFFTYIDKVAASASESSPAFNFVSSFDMRTRVRNGADVSAIVPFESVFSVTEAGGSVNAVRTADV